ncbi:Hypothetical predicted protein [Octopus vulgaris]|uniref:Uncharacterized protein n=1 Tax=Octopus vulgaris TaxID=6645 RepID=A0AA36F4D9_OCTVU|nr:Hypothetical predicted protein [Octopus vulgaris]
MMFAVLAMGTEVLLKSARRSNRLKRTREGPPSTANEGPQISKLTLNSNGMYPLKLPFSNLELRLFILKMGYAKAKQTKGYRAKVFRKLNSPYQN